MPTIVNPIAASTLSDVPHYVTCFRLVSSYLRELSLHVPHFVTFTWHSSCPYVDYIDVSDLAQALHIVMYRRRPVERQEIVGADNMKSRITWNGQGGELDSVLVNGDEYEGAITAALIKMLNGNIVTPGDSFAVTELTD